MEEVAGETQRQTAGSGDLVEELQQSVAQLANLTGWLMAETARMKCPILFSTISSPGRTTLQISEGSRFIETSHSTTSGAHSSVISQLDNLHDDASATVAMINETRTNLVVSQAVAANTNSTLSSNPLQKPVFKTSLTGWVCALTRSDAVRAGDEEGDSADGSDREREE